MEQSQLLQSAIVLAGGVSMLLSATYRAWKWSRRFLPIGGSDFNQAAILILFAVSVTTIFAVLFPGYLSTLQR